MQEERRARMEERKEERAVGSPMHAAHVDTSRPREDFLLNRKNVFIHNVSMKTAENTGKLLHSFKS